MAKKKVPGVQNRHMYSRISFLYQAAAYLAEVGEPDSESKSESIRQTTPRTTDPDTHMDDDSPRCGAPAPAPGPTTQALSRKLLTDLRSVTLKNQIRISPDIKRTICKHCDTLLVEGQTCTSAVENKSRGGRKPWADVLTIRCHTCSREKRFPVSASRQKRRPVRAPEQQKQETGETTSLDLQAQAQKNP